MEKDSTEVEPKRLLLGFVLSLGLISVWFWLFPPVPAAKPRLPASPRATAPAGEAARSPVGGSVAPAVAATPAGTPAVAAASEAQVVLEAGGTRIVLSNLGAQAVSVVVPESSKPGARTLEMVRRRAEGPYPFGLTGDGFAPSALNAALFAVERASDGRSAVFRYGGPAGSAEKTFRVDDKGLINAEVRVAGSRPWGMVLGPGVRDSADVGATSRFDVREAVYDQGGSVGRLNPEKTEGTRAIGAGTLRWIGLEDHYFLCAALVGADLGRAVLSPRLVIPGAGGEARFEHVPAKEEMTPEQKKLARDYLVILEPTGGELKVATFWGPKEVERLSSLPGHLDGSVKLTVGIVARPLLAGLRWIHDRIVPNYGWAIILMTCLIKLVLLPVTHQSMMSTRKMQELNPKIQAIREKYRGKMRDKQGRPNTEIQRKMQEETMGVYRAAGVNPAGGCFPMLLQMPVFFAFYSVLGSAVELRGAPWILWIQDLSVAEPHVIKVLPLVMGITQFLQVRLGPQATDPMQRRLFQLMPIMMTFVLWGFPAGLALYWLTNNVLTIAQLAVYKRLQERQG
jgi:YidC/Oxa1 family membrane protein insertase